MHKKDADAQQGHQRQDPPGQVGLNAVNGKQRPARARYAAAAQPGFVSHVIDGVKAGGEQLGLQQDLRRRNADVEAEHQRHRQRKAEEEGQQKKQREEDVKVKAHPAKLKVRQGGDKQRGKQPDHQQAGKLHQAHCASPAAMRSARCQGCR